MDNHTRTLLEYDAVLDWLAGETHSEAGRLAALSLEPDFQPDEVLESWSLIEEGRDILNEDGYLDLTGHLELAALLEPLKVEGAMLDIEALRAVGQEARCGKAAKSFFAPLAENAPGLSALAEGLAVFPDLIDAVERTIGPDGEILDTASPELARLRMEQSATRQGLTGKLTGLMRSESFHHIIQDDIITMRGDRFVVPVKASAAGRGLVHDWSSTGATAFMEPLEVVEDNNRLGLLKRREKVEIERILRRLSAECRAAAPELAASGKILTRLDVIMAQARLAKLWAAVRPDYLPGQGVELKAARHPLLMRRFMAQGGQMTPLELFIKPEKPLVIISGLNTGGKTVAMKTLGLNLLLAKTGLFLPVAHGSSLDLFEDVMAVMGDEQDLSSDLSTFSGHVRSLNRVLKEARPGRLILLDEIGSGTDPGEGAALGLAVLENLRPSGALVMAATHYHLIKSWGALAEGVVSAAVNSSSSGQPLYGLTYGAPGFSGGLKMARRLGLPSDLVNLAESYLDDGQRRAMELLARLDEERSALVAARNSFDEERLALARAERDLREQTRRQTEDFNRRAEALDKNIKDVLREVGHEFDSLKKALKTSGAGGQNNFLALSRQKADLEKRLRAARPHSAAEETPLLEVKVGDQVMVKKLGRLAVVRAVALEKGEAWVDAGGLNVKAALSDLFPAPLESGGNKKTVSVTVSPAESFGLSVNLLGKTVEEALIVVDKHLDQAARSGQKSLHIIHGYGTGRLRQGIRHFLHKHPRVKSFERATHNSGGDGVTVVELE